MYHIPVYTATTNKTQHDVWYTVVLLNTVYLYEYIHIYHTFLIYDISIYMHILYDICLIVVPASIQLASDRAA